MIKLKQAGIVGIVLLVVALVFNTDTNAAAPDCIPGDFTYIGWVPDFYGNPAYGLWEVEWVDAITGEQTEECTTRIEMGPVN